MLERRLGNDPMAALWGWLGEAEVAGIPLHDAVCLATATRDGAPSARMVLFRGIERGRLAFYTDYRSRKSVELTSNPRAAMVFYWQALGRQVRVEGTVERLDAAWSDAYFLSRPRGSRISAWASTQSAEVDSRDELARRWTEVAERFRGVEVERPEHAGGFGLLPESIEFWQQRDDRLHDRVIFRHGPAGWSRNRLQP